MIVDAHCHIWSYDAVAYYGNKPLFVYMQEHGIDKAALICMSEAENQRMRELVSRFPDRLYGVSYVDFSNLDASLEKLRADVKSGVSKAVKLYPYFEHFSVDDRALHPFYETACELELPVIPHLGWVNMDEDRSCGHTGKYQYTGFPPQYGTVLEAFPQLKLVFTHLGGNYYYEFLTMAERFPNVVMETAWLADYCRRQFPVWDLHDWIRHAIGFVGAGRVIFGGEGVFPEDIVKLRLHACDTAKILGENARRYFKL